MAQIGFVADKMMECIRLLVKKIMVSIAIKLNPVRAGMVDPADYSFSSYQINALGKQSDLCTPHSEYLALDHNALDRMQNYRALFKQALDNKLIVNIRNTTNKGMAIGSDRFITEIKELTGYNLGNRNRGRPNGWRKQKI